MQLGASQGNYRLTGPLLDSVKEMVSDTSSTGALLELVSEIVPVWSLG